jgi:hypothetical protein
MSKPFEEHMPEILNSLSCDPEGLYQVTYRVGPLMVSAQIWRDATWNQPMREQFSNFDREFLKEIRVLTDDSTEGFTRK